MRDKVFIDTNLWIYLYSDEAKGEVVRDLMNKHFENIQISAQVLGEFFTVMVKKGFRKKSEAKQILSEVIATFPITEIRQSSVMKAMSMSIR